MVGKTLLAGTALAAAANALPNGPPSFATTVDPYCSSISSAAPYFPTQSAQASSFCSSYFHISTRTTTTTTTATTSVTATSDVAATTTTTPTTTVYASTSTCYTSPAGSANGRRAAEPQPATTSPTPTYPNYSSSAAAASSSMSAAVSSACSCFGVTVSPTVTATATATSSTTVATVTSTTTTITVTAPASTVTATATSTIPPSSTYTSPPSGTRFLDYDGYDFYSNNLASSYCGANGMFSLPDGSSVPCTGFDSCQDACVAYNNASGSAQCVGASYLIPNVFCYLKSYIDDCNVMPNSNVDSGAIEH